MKQDDTPGRGPADQAPSTQEDRREANRLARQKRRTQRKMQRQAEAARLQADQEATLRLPARAAPAARAAPSPNPVGQLAGRVGRIGANMVLKQIIRALLSVVLRR